MKSLKIFLCAAAVIGLAAFTNAPAGMIGGTTPDWNNWTEVAGLPAARYGLAVDVLNGSLYAVGGHNNGAQTNVYRFDGTNWTETAGLPAPRRYLAAGVLNGALYAVGGDNGGVKTNVYRFDGTNWTEVAGLPAQRENLTAGVLNGALYAVGGDNGGAETNVYRFDGTNWTETAGLPAPRWFLAAGALNGALYAVAGADGTFTAQTNVYRFDGTNWTETAGLPAPRWQLAASVLNNRLYAIGGMSGSDATNVYSFDGTNWIEVAGLPVPRRIHAAATYNGALYTIAGGLGGWTTNVYRYPALIAYSGVSPSSGSVTGGYQVVITGTNLSDGTDVTNVTLCGVNVSAINSMTGSTQIVVTAGAGIPGVGDVRVYSTSAGVSVASNAFTYLMPGLSVLGTNGAAIASGAAASAAKGTDFGSLTWGSALTNTFAITNPGNNTLVISGVTTNGAGAGAFSIFNLQFSITAGAASNFTVRFAPPNAGTYTAAVQIANNSTTTPYIIHLAGILNPAPTPNGWLAVQVTPADGSWALSAPDGYSGPTSGTGNLAAVSAVTGQYGVSYGALSGYVAPSNQSGFVTGGNTTLFIAVYLQISPNIGTPAGVSATEGTYTNRIRVIWQGVAGSTGYEIWRSQTNDANAAGRIADIPANQSLRDQRSEVSNQSSAYYYDDYAINPINAYYYWVRAKTAALISPMSYVGMGYAALNSDQTQGTADISVSDLVYLPVNMTNLSSAGTVSCRLTNAGPDALNVAAVAFDFHMGTNATVWIGSAQSNLTLNAGAETLVILAPQAKRALTVRGDLSGVQQVKVVVRHLSALNDPNPANNTAAAAGTVRIKALGVNSPGRSFNDYDGDGKSDGCLYQSALGRWYLEWYC